MTSDSGNDRRARAVRKDPRIAGRRKALKGESQERPDQKWLEGSKESKASREDRTPKTQRAEAGNLGEYGSFELVIAVGKKTP